MSGDTFHISGSITGSNVGGYGNTVNNEGSCLDTRTHLYQLIDDARVQTRALPLGRSGRDEIVGELDGLQDDLDRGASLDEVSGRLRRLEEWAAAANLLSVITGVVTAVKGWFG